MRDFVHLEGTNDISLFLDDALREVAPQKLPDVDSNGIAILEWGGRAHRSVAHHNRTISFNYLQEACPLVVIAKNLQQDVAARARGKQNITGVQPARVVRRSEEHTSELQSRGHLVCLL